MHLGGNILSFPSGEDSWKHVDDIFGPLSDFVGVENDIVMMEIKDHGNIELFANR